MNRKKSIFNFLLVIGIVFLTPLLNLPLYYHAKPPKSVIDIKSFFEWKNSVGTIYFIENPDGSEYFLITGHSGKLLVPSGPAGYFFDQHGYYVGWAADIGDSKFPAKIPQEGNKRTTISKEELVQKTSISSPTS